MSEGFRLLGGGASLAVVIGFESAERVLEVCALAFLSQLRGHKALLLLFSSEQGQGKGDACTQEVRASAQGAEVVPGAVGEIDGVVRTEVGLGGSALRAGPFPGGLKAADGGMGLELFPDGGARWPGVKGRKKRFKGRGRSLLEQGFRQPALKARLRGSQRGVVLELPLYACLPREACLQHIVLQSRGPLQRH